MVTSAETSRYAAIAGRRPDPSFVFAVRTTGVVCRCGCPSRTPSPRNVLYFDDVAAALNAGFRPCKRCAPEDASPDSERARLVAKACALFDDPRAPSVEHVATSLGLSRFHFARVFRAVLGTTPAAYRRARRDRRLRRELARETTVTQAVFDAGFGSTSRAYGARPLGMTPLAYKRGARGERIAYAIAACALGRVVVARTERGVCAIELGDDDRALVDALRKDFPGAELVRDDAASSEALAAIVAAIERPALAPEIDLDIRGTAFQERVWRALRDLRPGERVTYAEIARRIGQPRAARAIGAACAANKLAVTIPCHRVTAGDGTLSGYRWGTERKRRLLETERTTD